ncbi:hypothetical protein HMN09_00868300 [Mycena chlorophos]|uniref:Zn(2)-C6 fungal-type domain-containing protein n=1 Tax=Mycena chlorophos TaxID=658473 RepID=A0A8H6SP52_MYCCL|nr:hypothetical protein HMN09_00868300 [Mycena chlorophos]
MAGDGDDEQGSSKRRRLQGSCDACKRKKIRCDSAEMPNNRCTNCISSGIACIHSRAKTQTNDGERLKAAQEYVANSISTTYTPPKDLTTSNHMLLEVCQYARSLEEKLAEAEDKLRSQTTKPPKDPPAPHGVLVDYHSPVIAGCFNETLDPCSGYQRTNRYYGTSSTSQFVKNAIRHVHDGQTYIVGIQRVDFWTPPLWEKFTIMTPALVFPETDLLQTLVHIYFEQVDPVVGILHRPSFERFFAANRHLADRAFGEVVLAICAVASKYCDDPRVFLDDAPRDDEHSAGWKWFAQVRPTSATLDSNQALLQLQKIALGTIFFSGSSTPDECWFHVGVGLRYLKVIGAENPEWYQRPSLTPLDAELYKRVFWMLVFWEYIMTVFKGRVPAITSFKAPLPTTLDYEYWDLPADELAEVEKQHKQAGKTSLNGFLRPYMGLIPLYRDIQQRVYPHDKHAPTNDDIMALDSAVNEWVDSIPEYLKWDPQQDNQTWLDQSAMLYASYYHAQILIHRPFITAPGKDSGTSMNSTFPSMAICANAARSLGHVLETQTRRGRGVVLCPGTITMLFDASVVLLINVWRLGSNNRSNDFNRANADVRNCLKVLRLYERRWRVAGRCCDIITAMLNFGKTRSELKRPRRHDEELEAPQLNPAASTPTPSDGTTTGSSAEPSEAEASPSIGGTQPRPGSVEEQMEALERSMAETDHLFMDANPNPSSMDLGMDFADLMNMRMPIYSTELGQLPVSLPQAQEQQRFPYTVQQQIHQSIQSSLYLPHSDLVDEVPGVLPPELEFLAQSQFVESESQSTSASATDPQGNAFEVPLAPYWDQWSAYILNVGGMQG